MQNAENNPTVHKDVQDDFNDMKSEQADLLRRVRNFTNSGNVSIGQLKEILEILDPKQVFPMYKDGKEVKKV